MVGGLIIGDAPAWRAPSTQATRRVAFVNDPDFVYLSTAWRIPGEPEDVVLDLGVAGDCAGCRHAQSLLACEHA